MIYVYFVHIFNCILVYNVFLMCQYTYVPHKFLLQMLVYMFVTFIKVKLDVGKNL